MQEQYLTGLDRLQHGFATWWSSLQPIDYLMFFGVFLGLAAVYLFIRGDRTERQRIESEYQHRVAEREYALRKEVYLPAAEAIARAQDFLGKFPTSAMPRDQAQMVVDHVLGALGKAQLVASDTSVRPVMAVATEFANGYMALAARRQPIAALSTELEDLDRRVSHLSVERDHLLASITRMAGDGADAQTGLWKDMNLRFDKLHREIGTLLGQRKDKLSQRTKLEHELALETTQRSLRLAKLSVPAYLALRDELRLDIDESQYRNMAQRSIGEIERTLKELAQTGGAKSERKASGQPPRREPVIAPEEAPREAKLRMVVKGSG